MAQSGSEATTQVPHTAANLDTVTPCALATTSASMPNGDSVDSADASGVIGGTCQLQRDAAHGEHGQSVLEADVNAPGPVHVPHATAAASAPAAESVILEGVAQTWALEKSLAAACPQYELLLHEALTLQLAQWPKVKRVLQNATARWQDQSSASSVPLSLCPSLSLGDSTVKTTELLAACLTQARTHTHTHTHTLCHTHCGTHTHWHTQTHSLTHTLAKTHTKNKHIHTSNTQTQTQTHTHTHTH
jgi:hypothetical protein